MDDILAKKNRHLFLEEKDNQNNSFIGNINDVASRKTELDAVAAHITSVDTVGDHIDNVDTVANNISDINDAVDNIATVKTFNDNVNNGTMQYLLEAFTTSLNEQGNTWEVRLTQLGESILATTSAFNYSTVVTVSSDIPANGTLILPNSMKYKVGTHMLMVSWNGTVCYAGEQYDEVGAYGVWATSITLKQPAKVGDKIQLRIVALTDQSSYVDITEAAINASQFTASGSNTERYLPEFLGDVVNVKNFGAVGNGVNDDTTAFQSAIVTGKAVFVPEGTYKLSTDLNGVFCGVGNSIFIGGTVNSSTILRGIAQKNSDIINVRDFGAKGDGSDDTAAIQAALDYANTDADNRPVIAFGDFVITSTLEVGRPGSTRLDEPQQEFYFGNLICGSDSHPWQGQSTDPAVHLRAWRGIFRVDQINCRKQCAGLFIDTYGANVHNPAIYDFALDTYGLKWSLSGNIIWNPKIGHDRSTEPSVQNRTPGILCSGIDSKIFGGIVGNCSPGIQITETAAGNFFHGIHIYCGSEINNAPSVTDPVLVKNDTAAPNFMFNCYYDSGHVDLYKPSLRMYGGWLLKNTDISVLNGSFIRCYAPDNTGNFANIHVENIEGADASFLSGSSTTIPDTYNYSVINSLEPGSGIDYQSFRQKNLICPNGYNAPFETVYKPVGALSRGYKVGSGLGTKIIYLDNAIRVQDYAGTSAGARIYLGGGSPGIGELNSGVVALYAGDTVHVVCAGNSEQDDHGAVRPGVNNFDTLGSGAYRWKELYCSNGTINTSDEREKQQIEDIPEAVLRAWSKVEFMQYKWNDAVAQKGESARFHTGAVAQRIVEAFASEGLDATQYGLLCYDEWPAESHEVKVVDKEAIVNEEDVTVEPEISHMETIVDPAGNRYSLRYEECLCLEAAYQRWLGEQRDAKIEALMQRISALENNQ